MPSHAKKDAEKAVNHQNDLMKDMNNMQLETDSNATSDNAESDEVFEEMLIMLELPDFKDHPILDKESTCTITELDTDHPILRIGEYELNGKLHETVGTTFFYDVSNPKFEPIGHTNAVIKFTIDTQIDQNP